LNSNTFVNKELSGLPKPRSTINTYGGASAADRDSQGCDGHNKAFFNQEEAFSRTRWRARGGINDKAARAASRQPGAPQTVNVLQLAAANGQASSIRPSCPAPTRFAGDADPRVRSGLVHQPECEDLQLAEPEPAPPFADRQLDLNMSAKHHAGRITGSGQRQPDTLNTDPTFPIPAARAPGVLPHE
jgi:hypothetical protein